MPPADHRFSVGMVEIKRSLDLLGEASARIVSHALVLLFENDIPLGYYDFIGKLQAGHPVRFEFHDSLQLVAWHALEVAGVVLRCEGILLPADARDYL